MDFLIMDFFGSLLPSAHPFLAGLKRTERKAERLGGKYLPINTPPPTKLVFFYSGQMGRISSVKPGMVMVLIQNISGGWRKSTVSCCQISKGIPELPRPA